MVNIKVMDVPIDIRLFISFLCGRDGLSGTALDYRSETDPESRVRAQVPSWRCPTRPLSLLFPNLPC